jgi:hypothetical protein
VVPLEKLACSRAIRHTNPYNSKSIETRGSSITPLMRLATPKGVAGDIV